MRCIAYYVQPLKTDQPALVVVDIDKQESHVFEIDAKNIARLTAEGADIIASAMGNFSWKFGAQELMLSWPKHDPPSDT